jgi:NADH dehydrogenase (ubiquinone) Fe-S protein 6
VVVRRFRPVAQVARPCKTAAREGWKCPGGNANADAMSTAPETVSTASPRVCCDGATAIRSTGRYAPAALGHPRVWLEIDERGFVDCPYCDKRFVLDGAGEHGAHAH